MTRGLPYRGEVDAEAARNELSRSCWRHVVVVKEWSPGRVLLARAPRPLVHKLFRGDAGYRNALGLVAFVVAMLVTAKLQSLESGQWQGYAWIVGSALAAAALLYWSVREPGAVLDLRGSDLRVGSRRIDLASLRAVVMGEHVFEDFRLMDAGQSIADDTKRFYRLDLRTTGGSHRLVVSPSEREWSAEEVSASRSFADALARRLSTELQLEDRR